VGEETPKIEVRYEHLSVEGNAHTGSRALPTLFNSTLNTIEVFVSFLFQCVLSKRKNINLMFDI